MTGEDFSGGASGLDELYNYCCLNGKATSLCGRLENALMKGPVVCLKCRQVLGSHECFHQGSCRPTINVFVGLLNSQGKVLTDMMRYWLKRVPAPEASRQSDVPVDVAEDKYRTCRRAAHKIIWHDFRPVGGLGDVVEVGLVRLRNGKWIFAGRSRASEAIFALIAEGSPDKNLPQLAQKYVNKDSALCSSDRDLISKCAHRLCDHHEQRTAVKKTLSRSGKTFPSRSGNPVKIDTLLQQLSCLLDAFEDKKQLEEYLSEWMYRNNVLAPIKPSEGRFERFLEDIVRIHRADPERHSCKCQCTT